MTRREAGRSNYVRKPERQGSTNRRAVTTLALTLLLPPIGLFYMWGRGVFRARGRVLLSLVAVAEMALVISLLLPKTPMASVRPVASVPTAVTAAPDQDVADALSNLEALLSDSYATPAPTGALSEEELAAQKAQEEADLEALLNTEVYSVYGDSAKYYHNVQLCEGQKNSRVLTIREALAAKMGACPNCKPPAPS